jgi:hypothetical protein
VKRKVQHLPMIIVVRGKLMRGGGISSESTLALFHWTPMCANED